MVSQEPFFKEIFKKSPTYAEPNKKEKQEQLEVKVPPMSTPEETLRLRGKGVAFEGGAGDLLVHVTATLPRKLSGKAKKAIEDLKAEGL